MECKAVEKDIAANMMADWLGDYVHTCTDTEMSEIDKGMLHSLGISVPYIERG